MTRSAVHATGRIVSLCFLVAFISAYLQLGTLTGAHGLEPHSTERYSEASWSAFLWGSSSLLVWRNYLGLSADVAMEGVCIAGILLAAFALTRRHLGPLPFLGLFVLYQSVYVFGGTFLSFQWDMLLLEAGWACVWTFPLLHRSGGGHNAAGEWLLRFCAFKLLVMAGAVKLLSDCPTWSALTATEVHFASQCLPTPLAWAFHSSPPLLHRVEVAATLWIELVAPVLLLLPPIAPHLLRLGVALQLLLQAVIALSGNYTFFNLLTAAIAIAAWPGAWGEGDAPHSGSAVVVGVLVEAGKAAAPAPAAPTGWLRPVVHATRVAAAWAYGLAQAALALLLFAVTWDHFFHVMDRGAGLAWWQRWDMILSPELSRGNYAGFKALLDEALPLCVWWAAAVIAATSLWGAGGELLHCGRTWARGAGAAAAFAAALLCRCYYCCHRRAAVTATKAPANGSPSEGQQSPPPPPSRRARAAATACCAASWNVAGANLRAGWALLSLAAVWWTFLLSATMLLTLRPDSLLKPAVVLPEMAHSLASASLQLPWRVASGYGLFRRMTGVGLSGGLDASGLQVTETARPELEIQALWAEEGLCDLPPGSGTSLHCVPRPLGAEYASEDAATVGTAALARRNQMSREQGGLALPPPAAWVWRPLHLPYKPGDVWAAPRFVAPHQPRADWQMWFAALVPGPQMAAWLLRWAGLLLEANSPEAFSLLDTGAYPLRVRAATAQHARANHSVPSGESRQPQQQQQQAREYLLPPSAIRIVKYTYDFTRPDVPWGQRRHEALDPGAYASPRLPWWQRRLDTSSSDDTPAAQRGEEGRAKGKTRRAGAAPTWVPGAPVPMWLPPIVRDMQEVQTYLAARGLPQVFSSPSRGLLPPGDGYGDHLPFLVAAHVAPPRGATSTPPAGGSSRVLELELSPAGPLSPPSADDAQAPGFPAAAAKAGESAASLLRGRGPPLSCEAVGRRAARYMDNRELMAEDGALPALAKLRRRKPLTLERALRGLQQSRLARVLLGLYSSAAEAAAEAIVAGLTMNPAAALAALPQRALRLADTGSLAEGAADSLRWAVWVSLRLTDAAVGDADDLAGLLPRLVLPLAGRAVCSTVQAWRAMGLASPALAGHVIEVVTGSAGSGGDVGSVVVAAQRDGQLQAVDLVAFPGVRLVYAPTSIHASPLWLLAGLLAAAAVRGAWCSRRGVGEKGARGREAPE